jgi:16S rRNA (guanine1207-N2)-methyltransferase
MSALPNSHQALLKNIGRLSGRCAILGLTAPALLDQIPGKCLVITDNAGIHARLAGHDGCTPVFGYDHPALSEAAPETVVIFIPKSRSELSLRLALARHLVAPGGRIILVGEKKEGIAGAVRQLREQLPQAEKIDSARHCQVWLADGVTPSAEFRLADWLQWHRIERKGTALEVAGLPGIFSDGELDAGTAMLLDTLAAEPPASGKILDFACGAGVIGAWWQRFQIEKGDTANPVDGVDVQFQATVCARETYRRAGVEGQIQASDGLSAVDGRYQTVITNPPFHTGVRTDTSVTEAFLRDVKGHLLAGGELRLVANRFLPYQELIRRHLGPVRVLAEDSRFVVWSANRS